MKIVFDFELFGESSKVVDVFLPSFPRHVQHAALGSPDGKHLTTNLSQLGQTVAQVRAEPLHLC